MAGGQLGTVIQHIRKLAATHATQELTDGQLLEQSRARSKEARSMAQLR
jgi:hypothetical protein